MIVRFFAIAIVVLAFVPSEALAQYPYPRWAGGYGGRYRDYNRNGQACASTRQRFEQASALILRGASRYRRDTRRGVVQGASDALWNDSWQADCRREQEEYARAAGTTGGRVCQQAPCLYNQSGEFAFVKINGELVDRIGPNESISIHLTAMKYEAVGVPSIGGDSLSHADVQLKIEPLQGGSGKIVRKAANGR